jgi:hypothetical protein
VREREITDVVDLCLSDGRLNRGAIGWSRGALHRANLRGWGRTKRWEYWGVVTPSHVIALTVSSLDYVGLSEVYVLDRERGEETLRRAITPLGAGVELHELCSDPVRAKAPSLSIAIDDAPRGTWLRASARGLEVEIFAARPEGHEAMGVVVPWSDRRFQYTLKDVARPARGQLVLEGRAHTLSTGSFAVLDHGRGRWPYRVAWNWAAASGVVDGRTLGLTLGGKWTDGTGSTENALLVGGRLHKISEELEWSYDRAAWTKPWRIRGARVDARLTPFHERRSRANLGVLSTEVHQCFGRFEGWASTDAGERISLDGLDGWAEEARHRW